jgi:hypothetical protein
MVWKNKMLEQLKTPLQAMLAELQGVLSWEKSVRQLAKCGIAMADILR